MKTSTINRSYTASLALYERAKKSIPLASQTFSKSITQYPMGVSPLFIKRGMGSHVWDVDDNEYIDFVNALLAVMLGYNDADVNAAVLAQINNGVSFSLAHPLECQLAEKIIEMVPSAEMVRFAKNGSDVTAAAVRLARAYTGREHIITCGYHGWQDWYIGITTRNLGVPHSTQALTHSFAYNDLDALAELFAEYPQQIAAVIMEPMTFEYPKESFLEHVKQMTHQAGAILVFDEMITGFRWSKGGAQEYFNVIPDLTTMGKGMANGYPLSAIAGRKEIMQLMENIFFSSTFGGETVSIAAAIATLEKIEKNSVIEQLNIKGQYLLKEIQGLIQKHQLKDILDIVGHPVWTLLCFKDFKQYSQWQIKTFWMQEILRRGILSTGTHNLSYAHTDEDINYLLAVYDEVFKLMGESIRDGSLVSKLNCEALKPLFSVRPLVKL